MSLAKTAALCAGVATMPILIIGSAYLFPWESLRPSQQDEVAANAQRMTVGGVRDRYLAELTVSYARRNDATVTEAMRAGRQLAPTQFLNDELEQRGVKWRVRSSESLPAETYDVS